MSKRFATVSYAIREADGIEKLIEFLESLSHFKISTNTDVVIAVKESSETFFMEAKIIVRNAQKIIPSAKLIFIPPGGFDLGTHYQVALRSKSEVLILMTASSRANALGWDSILLKKFSDPTVGIVGSMYSKESIKSSYLEMLDIMLKIKFHIRLDKTEKLMAEIRGQNYNNSKYSIFHNSTVRPFLGILRKWVLYANRGKEPFSFIGDFPDFPNPHLRTTGFAIRRELLLSVIDEIPQTKSDAFKYESGFQSITRRSLSLGWKVLVVDQQKKFREIDSEKISSTFRVRKVDSIVTDHESRNFYELSARKRHAWSIVTHGKSSLN
jgi:hypothetical protein